jgi:hypothetical protein
MAWPVSSRNRPVSRTEYAGLAAGLGKLADVTGVNKTSFMPLFSKTKLHSWNQVQEPLLQQ